MRLAVLLLMAQTAGAQWNYTTNLVSRPDNMSIAGTWQPNTANISATFGVTDPDGGSAATRWTASASGNQSILQRFAIDNATYTLTVKAKSATQWAVVGLSDFTSNAFAGYFDLTNGVTGTCTTAGSVTCTSSISSLSGGWYLLTVTGSVPSGSSSCTVAVSGGATCQYYLDIRSTTANGTPTNWPSGASIDLYHPMVNKGSSATAYNAPVAKGKYSYFGFIGGPPRPSLPPGDPIERFRSTTGDGSTWAGNAGSWTGLIPNAPSVIRWRNGWYFHVAEANSQNCLTGCSAKNWYIGTADANGNITTTLTMDWSSHITGLFATFSGMFFMDEGDTYPRLIVPCSISNVNQMQIYESHATAADWMSNTASWSAPVLITVTSRSNIYDPKLWKIGSTYYMWMTNQGAGFCIELATASTLTGPYTVVKSGDWAGWGISGGGNSCNLEAPTMFYTGSGWTLAMEMNRAVTVPNYQIFNATCNTLDPTACTWSSRAAWAEDLLYRHGSVIRTPGPEAGAVLAIQ